MRDDSHFESESAVAEATSLWRSRAATGAGAIMSLVILGAVVVWSYRLGVRDHQDIPVIRTELAATKVRPAEPGGETVAHQDRPVFDAVGGGEPAAPAEEGFAPPAGALADEDVAPIVLAPKPRGRPSEAADAAAPTPEAPAPIAEGPPEEDAGTDDAGTDVAAAPSDDAPGADALSAGDEIDALVREALKDEERSPHAPAGAPQARPRPDRAARAAPPPEPVEAARASSVQIQLGAFVSEALATSEWERIKGRNADLLTGRGRVVTPVSSGGRTLYRLRAGPFETKSQAASLCRGLIQRGADCIVASAE